MKDEKLISIIVPIYNVEQYLGECVDSILSQTYKNLEIILVDDGSPDNCGAICDEYAKKDKRIRVIHKENGGLSSARNAGLDVATGEYISFIDSDDYVSEKFIEVLYNLCKKNSADISECDFIKFDDKVEVIESDIKVEKHSSIEMQKNIYSSECVKTVVVWNKLYKRYIYEKLRFPEGKINEDEFTTYKAFDSTAKDIVVTNEPLYYYRYNENSIMGRKFNVKRLDVLQAYGERIEYYRDKNYKDLFEKTVEGYQQLLKKYFILTKECIVCSEEYQRDILKLLKKNYKDYKFLKSVSIISKIKMLTLIKFPNVIYNLINLKNKNGKEL